MKSFERVTSAFIDRGLTVKPGGHGRASAQAPGHSPADLSVVITYTEGRTLVHSHSDPTDDVLAAVGLTMPDLFDEAAGVTYCYSDGRQVHRSTTKRFKQTGNTKGRSLYRAEKLPADLSVPVYVVEGEQDVHALEAVGAVAVSGAGGACKAHLVDWTPLRGRTAIVVQDKDEPGRRHGAQVRDQLGGIAASVAIVEAAVGKDAADHIAAGHGVDKFVPLDTPVDAEPRPRVWKATELECARRIDWLASRRLPAAAVAYMLGPEGIGKSLFLVWLTALVTTGKPFGKFGIPARAPQVVVLVLTEDDWSTVVRPRLEVAGADLEYVRVICAEADGSGTPTFPNDMDVVAEAAADASLVIVDAWADTLPGSLTVKDPQHARRALHPWKELATRSGAAILLTGHTNREKGSNVRNAYGLTGELRKKARMTILAQPDADEEGVLVIGPEKSNLTAAVPASRFRIESVQVFERTEDSDGTVPKLVWIGDAEQSAREFFAEAADSEDGEGAEERTTAEEWLKRYLTAEPGADSAEVKKAAKGADISERTLQRARKKLGVKPRLEGSPPRSYWELPSVPHAPNVSEGGTDGRDGINVGQASMPPAAKSNFAICATPGDTGADVAKMTTGPQPSTAPTPPVRLCPECNEPLPAGRGRHVECMRRTA